MRTLKVLSNTNEGASLHEVCRNSPFLRRNYGILIADLSVLRFGRLKRNLESSTCTSYRSGDCAPLGASSFVVVQGFSRASLEHGRRLRPLSFPVKLNPGHGEKE